MFGEAIYAICQKQVSRNCYSLNGEETLIYNKARMACKYCNEQIKSGKRTERKEQSIKIKSAINEMVAKTSLSTQDQIFYRKAWNLKADWKGGCTCEECGIFLKYYSATYISHIISRGAETRLRHDLRNYNLLCLFCHNRYEFKDKENMKIYPKNIIIIEELKESLIK